MVAASLAAMPSMSSDLGEPPAAGTAARDLMGTFRLPSLRDRHDRGPDAAAVDRFFGLLVGRRASELRLDIRSAQRAWTDADATLDGARRRLDAARPVAARVFRGRRASQLNAVLRDPAVRAVRLVAARLEVDEPVTVRRANLHLDLGTTELRAAPDGPRFLLRVEDATAVTVAGGAFLAGHWGVLVGGGCDVTIDGGRYDGLTGGGVVLDRTVAAVLGRSRMTRLAGAGVLVHGDTTGSTIVDNTVTGGTGASNWMAAIVLSDRNGDVSRDPDDVILAADHHGPLSQPIPTRLHVPRRNVVASNRLSRNAASGIYVDGAIETVVFGNLVEGNAKEGMCLDNGATANVVAMNVVRRNGRRWGMSDADLKRDHILASGRLPDGTAAAKTPGISIDNAAYNVVYANQVDGNDGGGVKMVRTAYFNVIGLNIIADNNEGASAAFHFFGIELGAARADEPADDLDFTPSIGNVVFGNAIRGGHDAGIFYGAGSVANDTFDNSIFGATHWSMEQVVPQFNPTLNNLTNSPARNIDVGLSPGSPPWPDGAK